MKTRICPLCDQPMKKAHHCDSCGSFVWKPMYLDIHYKTGYDSGSDCAYDQNPHEYQYHDDGSVTMMPSKDRGKHKKFRGVQEIELPRYNTAESSERYDTTTPKSGRSAKNRGGCLKKIILIIVTLSIVFSVNSIVFSVISDMDFGEAVPEIGYGTAEEVEPMRETEYTEDEVIALGEECNGYTHMDMTCRDFVTKFEMRIREIYPDDLLEYYDDSYNHAYIYETGANTYYSSNRMYIFGDDKGYCTVNWDTYSERLHSIDFDIRGTELSEAFFNIVMKTLGLHDEQYLEQFQNQRSIAEDEGYVFYNTEDLEVYISYYDDGNAEKSSYYVSISKGM